MVFFLGIPNIHALVFDKDLSIDMWYSRLGYSTGNELNLIPHVILFSRSNNSKICDICPPF